MLSPYKLSNFSEHHCKIVQNFLSKEQHPSPLSLGGGGAGRGGGGWLKEKVVGIKWNTLY